MKEKPNPPSAPNLTPRQRQALAVMNKWATEALSRDAVPLACILGFQRDGAFHTGLLTYLLAELYPDLVADLRELADRLESTIKPPLPPGHNDN